MMVPLYTLTYTNDKPMIQYDYSGTSRYCLLDRKRIAFANNFQGGKHLSKILLFKHLKFQEFFCLLDFVSF